MKRFESLIFFFIATVLPLVRQGAVYYMCLVRLANSSTAMRSSDPGERSN